MADVMPESSVAFLSGNDVSRLVAAHIKAFQDRRISEGRIASQSAFEIAVARSGSGIEALTLDEATLDLDSLALLELVMEVTKFFNLQDSGVEDYLFVQRSFGEWVKLIQHHFVCVDDDACLTFRTSGSTGHPKGAKTAALQLLEEIDALCRMMGSSGMAAERIVSTVAPQHIYGLIWSVLLPRALGCPVVDRFKVSPSGTAKMTKAGDIVLSTPFLWEKFAEFEVQFAPGCVGVTSGGPARPKTYDAARAVGIEKLIEVYGSSETGGVGTRMNVAEDFTIMSHLVRDGEAVLRRTDGTSLALQDRILWTGEQQFKVLGRLDTTIQVAGTNVNLQEVEDLIETVPSVSEAAVRLDGYRLKAFVVPSLPRSHTIEHDIRTILQKLPAVARPDRIDFGSQLPLNEAGKRSDWNSKGLPQKSQWGEV